MSFQYTPREDRETGRRKQAEPAARPRADRGRRDEKSGRAEGEPRRQEACRGPLFCCRMTASRRVAARIPRGERGVSGSAGTRQPATRRRTVPASASSPARRAAPRPGMAGTGSGGVSSPSPPVSSPPPPVPPPPRIGVIAIAGLAVAGLAVAGLVVAGLVVAVPSAAVIPAVARVVRPLVRCRAGARGRGGEAHRSHVRPGGAVGRREHVIGVTRAGLQRRQRRRVRSAGHRGARGRRILRRGALVRPGPAVAGERQGRPRRRHTARGHRHGRAGGAGARGDVSPLPFVFAACTVTQ